MLAQVTLRNNDAITAPAGWTTTGNLRTSGTGLEQQIYYRIATAADTAGTTYQWSWTTSSDGAAAILAYSGTDATNPIDVTPTDSAGSGTTATATGLTTTQDNDMVDALYGAQGHSGPPPNMTQDPGQSLTQEYAISSGSSPASKALATGADGTLATAGATGNKTATISTSTPWVAHMVALMPPLAADGAGTLTTPTTNVSASQTGNTITFTYTAAAGGMNNGSLTLVVPAGWTAPSTVSNNAGYTTASTGTVSVASQTITVSSLTLAGGATMTLTYGNKSGGGSGATATASTGRADVAGAAESTQRRHAHEPRLVAQHHRERRRRLGNPHDRHERRLGEPDRQHDHLHVHGRNGRNQQRHGHASSSPPAGPLLRRLRPTPATQPRAPERCRWQARRSRSRP